MKADTIKDDIRFVKFIEGITNFTWNRCLEAQAKIKPVITKQEAYKMASRETVEHALKNNELRTLPKKGGKTAKVWIVRAEFDKWLMTTDILENKNRTSMTCKVMNAHDFAEEIIEASIISTKQSIKKHGNKR